MHITQSLSIGFSSGSDGTEGSDCFVDGAAGASLGPGLSSVCVGVLIELAADFKDDEEGPGLSSVPSTAASSTLR